MKAGCRVAFALLLLAALAVPAQTNYTIDWFTVAGGGGTSTGGVYSVSGTIGQPDAGAFPMSRISSNHKRSLTEFAHGRKNESFPSAKSRQVRSKGLKAIRPETTGPGFRECQVSWKVANP